MDVNTAMLIVMTGHGDVTVAVTHSSLNYKDGLAITGKAPSHHQRRSGS